MAIFKDDPTQKETRRRRPRSHSHTFVFLLAILDLFTVVGDASSASRAFPSPTSVSPSPSKQYFNSNHRNNYHVPASPLQNQQCIPSGNCAADTSEPPTSAPWLLQPREALRKRQLPSPINSSAPSPSSKPALLNNPSPIILPLMTNTSIAPPIFVTEFPRPLTKPTLLTDFEYETMWDADMDTLRLGILLSLNAQPGRREATLIRKALSVIRLAVNDVNEQQIIPGINMSIILRDSQDPSLYTASGGSAAISGAGMLIAAKVSGVIGDIRSDLTRYEALMTSSVEIPQCSFASVNTVLSDLNTYPFFFRTIPTIIALLDSVIDMIGSLGWSRISLVYDIETLGWSGREYFSTKTKEMGIYVLANLPMTTSGVPNDPTYKVIKDKIRSSQSRVQVLLATGPNQLEFLIEMKKSGFMSKDYAWITANDISSLLRNEADVQDYDGLIMIENGWELNGYGPYDSFLSDWLRLNPKEYPLAGDPVLNNNEGMAYSCVMMMAQAYGNLIKTSIPNAADRTRSNHLIRAILDGDYTEDSHIIEYFDSAPYEGPNGPITLDFNGDRMEGYYSIVSMHHGRAVQFATSFSGNFSWIRSPYFKDGYPNFPNDAPAGAVQNPRWIEATGAILGAFCFLGILLTLISAVLVIIYRNHIIIKAASPTFCICELFGILLIFIWCTIHIDIPRKGICMLQTFVLPIGVTLLAGSLTIKNYRIYRIFNSVTIANQAFQTRALIRYLALAVILSMIPIIIEFIIETPESQKVNIRAFQWVRCRGMETRAIWVVTASIVPGLLILFGVFLAFKTRNVVFLWNEAKQISFVMYNVFFFTIIMVISRFFPWDLYLATFYISLIGTYFVAFLSLTVLFAPKFWGIWQGRRKPWTQNEAHQHPSNQHQGGESFGDAAALGRMPEDFKFPQPLATPLGPSTPTTFTTKSHMSPAMKELTMAAAAAAETADTLPAALKNGRTPDLEAAGLVRNSEARPSRNSSVASQKPPLTKTRSRRTSAGTHGRKKSHQKNNPLGVWMNSRLPHRNAVAAAPTSGGIDDKPRGVSSQSQRRSQGGGKGSACAYGENSDEGALSGEISLNDISSNSRKAATDRGHKFQRLNKVEFSHNVDVAAATTRARDFVPEEPLNTGIHQNRTFGSTSSRISRMLDSYVFLLPLRVLRSRIVSFLSHWSMTTLILTPEAHAFLAVDSTSGRSTSYLMLSMNQTEDKDEPTLRITTCRAGTLPIRFSSQARLDHWMSLFSPQDLQELSAWSSAWNAAQSPNPVGLFAPDHNGSHGADGADENGQDLRRRFMNRTSDVVNHRRTLQYHESPENLPQSEPQFGGANDGHGEKGNDTDNGNHQQNNSHSEFSSWTSQLPFSHSLPGVWNGEDSDTQADRVSTSHIPKTKQSNMRLLPRQHSLASADAVTVSSPENTVGELSNRDLAVIPPIAADDSSPIDPQTSASSIRASTVPPVDLYNSDDSDDLYDPEFGIGGGGGRRHRRTGRPRVGNRPTSVATTSGNAVIPSAAVISAAAAAVSAGWSESEALAAATVNPSLLLASTQPPQTLGRGQFIDRSSRQNSQVSLSSLSRKITARLSRDNSLPLDSLLRASTPRGGSRGSSKRSSAASSIHSNLDGMSGGVGDTMRTFNGRVQMAPSTTGDGAGQPKRLSSSAAMLLGSASASASVASSPPHVGIASLTSKTQRPS